MTDKVVKEEYSFDFFQHDGGSTDSKSDKTQRLIISRNMDKLMEAFSDSRCRIYKIKRTTGKKQVDWELTHQIKKYPTPL